MTALGKYTLHEELGRGGFATVYRATHATLGIEAAVKVLGPQMAADEKARRRFVTEARLAANLEHPNIVRVLALEESAEPPYLAMEYMPGGDLKRWALAHQPPERAALLRILGEAAAALDFAHAQGVLHRDVKPGNILLDENGTAHVSDFGLARPAGAPHLTQVGSVVGTASYISPEQAEARPEIDGRADQYSLAVVAFELLAGQLPFRGENSTAVSLMHLTKPPPAPSSLNPEVPAEVDQILLKALAKAPPDRFPTCQAFVAALGEAFEASDLRRLRELLDEARRLLAEGSHPAAREKIDEARRLLTGRPEQGSALAELERLRQAAELYDTALAGWQNATAKAQAALDLAPDYPDAQGVFELLGLRKAAARRPSLKELGRQAGVGLLLALPLVLLAFYLGLRWVMQ